MSRALYLDGDASWHKYFILVRLEEALLPAEGGGDLYYSHLSACSRVYKLSGRGKDPKSLRMIEANANTKWRRKLVKCSPAPPEAVGYPIYRPRGELLGRVCLWGDVFIFYRWYGRWYGLVPYRWLVPAWFLLRAEGSVTYPTPPPPASGCPYCSG
jgi:hypothetical protein